MSRESRTVVTVFVGSPGDVEDERKAVFDVVSELNEIVAPKLGFLLEVKGWESVVRKSGRPQDQINPFVDKCDYFIGIMWKKWGMAPDNTGLYSSGFEEEFHRACNLRNSGQGPEISMFFRRIPSEVLEYGNESILKVVNFRQSLIDGYEHFFQDYVDQTDFTNFVRKVLTEFIFSLQTGATPDAAGGQTGVAVEKSDATGMQLISGEPEPVELPAFDQEEIDFAQSIIANTTGYDKLSAVDIARLRLISIRVGRSGNDKVVLGTHDCNLIYTNQSSLTLAIGEISHLIRAGLENFRTQYVPLWGWLRAAEQDIRVNIIFKTFAESEAQKISAISVLGLLGYDIIGVDEHFTRDKLLQIWLSGSQPDNFRKKVLQYLGEFGAYSDITMLTDMGEDLATVRVTVKEAEIMIESRNSTSNAVEVILKCEYALSDNTIDDVFRDVKSISSEKLIECTRQATPKLRLLAFRELVSRDAVTIELAKSLIQDSDVDVRYLALVEQEKKGVIVSDVDAQNIIIKTQNGKSSLFSSPSQPTPSEKRCWDNYKHQKLYSYSENDLVKSVKPDGVFDWEAEFALYASHFRKHGGELRTLLTDGFRAAMDRKFELYKGKTASLGQAHFSQVGELLSYIKSRLITDALAILAAHGGKADLSLVRKCIDDFEPSCSESVLKFFEKFGEWDDIERVAKIVGKSDNRYYGILSGASNHNQIATRIIATLCRNRVVDFFELPISSYIIQQALPQISPRSFSDLSNEKIIQLFNNESDGLRRALAMKVIGSLSRARVKEIHKAYLEATEYRYYNVIHWLDLGVSFPSATVKEVVSRAPRWL